MFVVNKYPFIPKDIIEFHLPQNAQLLRAGYQESTNKYCLWALVDPGLPLAIRRRIRMAGTGHKIDESSYNLLYINTDFMFNGLVFHYFEILY